MPSRDMHVMNNTKLSGLSQPVRVIAVTGGKGGVGKTSVSVNLATGLAAAGRRVVLLDGDLGLANVDVLLGLSPRYTLAHVLARRAHARRDHGHAPGRASGSCRPPRALRTWPSSARRRAPRPGAGLQQHRHTARCADHRHGRGHRPGVLQFSQAAQQVLVVVTDEPASLTDAYALIKVLSRDHGVSRFRVARQHVPRGRRRCRRCSANSSG